MKRQKIFYTELSYLLGLLTLAIGTAFMEKADFGMSMVVAPAYLLHLKLSETFPWFSFGMAEYCLQAVLLLITALVLKRWKMSYLLSFLTAVFYGFLLDGCIFALRGLPVALPFRVFHFVFGMVVCSLGVALLFHTYIAPEAYELLVKEVSAHLGKEISVVKTVYDCVSCAVAIVLSFLFFGFGHFEGVKAGTIFCALINGALIGWICKQLEKHFQFRDALRK